MRRPEWLELSHASIGDISEIRKLCEEAFPIDYSDLWYQEITSDGRFYMVLARHDNRLVGLIICSLVSIERLTMEKCPPFLELTTQSEADCKKPPSALYIMNIAIDSAYRQKGIGTFLLSLIVTYFIRKSSHTMDVESGKEENLPYLAWAVQDDQIRNLYATFPSKNELFDSCQAVYLHTLKTNQVAIDFYLSRGFSLHCHIPNFYNLQGVPMDALLFVLHINGGRAPLDLSTRILHAIDAYYNIPRSMFSFLRLSLGSLSAMVTTSVAMGYNLFSGVTNMLYKNTCSDDEDDDEEAVNYEEEDFIESDAESVPCPADEDSQANLVAITSAWKNSELTEKNNCLADHPLFKSPKGDSSCHKEKDDKGEQDSGGEADDDDDYDPYCLECKIESLNKKCDIHLPNSNAVSRAAYIFQQEMNDISEPSSSDEDEGNNAARSESNFDSDESS